MLAAAELARPSVSSQSVGSVRPAWFEHATSASAGTSGAWPADVLGGL